MVSPPGDPGSVSRHPARRTLRTLRSWSRVHRISPGREHQPDAEGAEEHIHHGSRKVQPVADHLHGQGDSRERRSPQDEPAGGLPRSTAPPCGDTDVLIQLIDRTQPVRRGPVLRARGGRFPLGLFAEQLIMELAFRSRLSPTRRIGHGVASEMTTAPVHHAWMGTDAVVMIGRSSLSSRWLRARQFPPAQERAPSSRR